MITTTKMNPAAETSDADSLGIYFRDLGKFAPLSAKKTAALFRQLRRTRSTALRNRLVEANLRLVVRIAKKYRNMGLDFEDLLQAGNIGLMEAVDHFDPSRRRRFSTCAGLWIRKYICSALTNESRTIRLPEHMVEKSARLKRTVQALAQELGAAPSIGDIASRTGQPADAIENLLRRSAPVRSIHEPCSPAADGDVLHIEDTLVDPSPRPDEWADLGDNADKIEAIRRKLADVSLVTRRDSDIFARSFGLNGYAPQTLVQIGKAVHLTRERVRQIVLHVTRTLQVALAA